MVSPANEAFLKFERRAEGADPEKLAETFVDVGPLFTLLGITDHQLINGRRGTGKTHALLYLAETKENDGDIAIFLDLRMVGSNTSIYADPTLPITERATRLLMDVLTEIHGKIREFLVANPERFDLSETALLLDAFSDAIGHVRVEGSFQVEEKLSARHTTGDKVSASLNLNAAATLDKSSIGASAGAEHISANEGASELRTTRSGSIRYHVHFGSVQSALSKLMSSLRGVRMWILLDEWSTLPPDLQPFLADLLRRSVFPVRGVTVKIAAIEQRSRFKIDGPSGTYVGLEIGADIPSDINLDDFMVFENQPLRARAFYKRLFYNHFKTGLSLSWTDAPRDEDALISVAFTQINVFDQLVQAAEGVPRDAMNIISLAATRALDDKIGMRHIREAARDWYQRGKERTLTSNDECLRLLHYIVDDVIGKKNARAFLLRSNMRSGLIDELFGARVLHVLKRNISGKDLPGVRYDVYKLDYGCYVELQNTAKEPSYLLAVGDDENSQVPQDDYRSIRRAILDLDSYFVSAPSEPAPVLSAR